MAYSYKTYSNTKEIMKKYVNAREGSIIYSMGRTHFIELAKKANAIYKVGATALVNVEIFERYLEQFRENAKPLPKHICNIDKEAIKERLK